MRRPPPHDQATLCEGGHTCPPEASTRALISLKPVYLSSSTQHRLGSAILSQWNAGQTLRGAVHIGGGGDGDRDALERGEPPLPPSLRGAQPMTPSAGLNGICNQQ